MRLDEALNLLGLKEESKAEDLDEKYRVLAASAHPDKGGSDEEMQRLNVARDIVSASYKSRSALIPIDAIKEIVIATNKGIAEYESKKGRSKLFTTRIVDINTSRPKKLRRMAALFGGVSAASIFLGKDIPREYFGYVEGVNPGIAPIVAVLFLSIAFYATVIWWFLDIKIKRIQQDTEDLEFGLNDKVYYVDLIHQILGGIVEKSWSKKQLEQSLQGWAAQEEYRSTTLARLINDAGPVDISNLILAKGIEIDVLRKETEAENKRLRELYSLNI